jgi:hypothetical protein
VLLGETCSWRGAAGDCYCSGDNGSNKCGGMDKKLADFANVQQKEMRDDQDDADKRGGQSPVRCLGNLDHGVMRGNDGWHSKSFYLSRILSSAETSLNLLKCMYSHCIVCLKLALHC